MTRDAQLMKVDALLGDRGGVPWEKPSAGLRVRTLSGLEPRAAINVSVAGQAGLRWWAMAAGLVIAGGLGMVLIRGGGVPVDSGISVGRVDPMPLFAPAFHRLTASADESMASEARELIESTNQLTKRVVAQLPFTGGS